MRGEQEEGVRYEDGDGGEMRGERITSRESIVDDITGRGEGVGQTDRRTDRRTD